MASTWARPEQSESLVDPALVGSQQAQKPGKRNAGAYEERLIDELAGGFLEELVRYAELSPPAAGLSQQAVGQGTAWM